MQYLCGSKSGAAVIVDVIGYRRDESVADVYAQKDFPIEHSPRKAEVVVEQHGRERPPLYVGESPASLDTGQLKEGFDDRVVTERERKLLLQPRDERRMLASKRTGSIHASPRFVCPLYLGFGILPVAAIPDNHLPLGPIFTRLSGRLRIGSVGILYTLAQVVRENGVVRELPIDFSSF